VLFAALTGKVLKFCVNAVPTEVTAICTFARLAKSVIAATPLLFGIRRKNAANRLRFELRKQCFFHALHLPFEPAPSAQLADGSAIAVPEIRTLANLRMIRSKNTQRVKPARGNSSTSA
jgi:hypothetical protein